MSLAYYEVSGGLLKFSLPPVSRSLHIDIYWQCCLGESQNISGLAWDSTKNSRYLKTHLIETSAVIVLYKISLVENIVFVSKNIAHRLNLVSESYPWKMSFTFWFYFLPFCCSCCLFWHCCNSFAFFGNLGYIGCCLKNYLALIFTLNWHFLWNSSVLKSATAAVAVQTNKHSCSSRLLGCPVSKFPRIIGWKSVSPVFWQWHWHSKSKEKNQFNEQNMQ